MEDSKLGVALTKEKCPVCCEDVSGDIVMNTRLTIGQAKKVEAMHGQVIGWKKTPCDKCMEGANSFEEGGVPMVGINPEKSDSGEGMNGVWRTGSVMTMRKTVFDDFFTDLDEGMLKFLDEHKFVFVEEATINKIQELSNIGV